MTLDTTVSPPSPHQHPRGFLALVGEYNPFYLISAACMLAGCLVLTNSLSWDPIAVHRLITLIVTLNVYEFALIGLALYLMSRRGLARDGTMLLVLEAFFLVDVTFLNAEIVTAHFTIGAAVNAILLTLALIKLGVVVYVLRPTIPRAQAMFIAFQLIALFVLPCVMRAIDKGYNVTPRSFYVAWWIIGLMPVMYDVLDRLARSRRSHVDPVGWANHRGAPVPLYLALPYFSLLLHLSILHYVYDARFYGADAAPVLIGLAFVLNRFVPFSELLRQQLVALRVALPIAAVVVSANRPDALGFVVLGEPITTLRIALIAAYLAYVYLFFLRYAIYCVVAGAAAMVAVMVAPSPATVFSFTWWMLSKAAELLRRLVPRTAAQWGVVSVAASFGFLVLGAAVSLLKSSSRIKPPAHPAEAGRASG